MIIKNLELYNFRNYDKLNIQFSKKINIIYGQNAQGKTNILEAIYTLLLTKSHRLNSGNNLIKKNESFTKLIGYFENGKLDNVLNLVIDDKGKHLQKNNNDIKKINDYINEANILIFYPEDLNLIKGSPGDRRRYLNIELCQLYKDYVILISDYNKLLKMRNDCLKKMKLGINIDLSYFNILTSYFIERAIKIYKIRKEFFDNLNSYCEQIYKKISKYEHFKIVYKPNNEIDDKDLLLNEFKKIYDDEVKYGMTMIGPHKDDYEFYLDNNNLKETGSQGQQRMAILTFKLSEINIFEQMKKDKPILLLDDVFSELDDMKKNLFLNYINDGMQVIITTTDLKNIKKEILCKAKLFEIENGMVKKVMEENYGK